MKKNKLIRDWSVIRKVEQRARVKFLRQLSTSESLKIFSDLIETGIANMPQIPFAKYQLKEKINSLTKIHNIFNKVDA